jgi:hypothetical protein
MADETPTPPSPQLPGPSQPASSPAEEGTPFEIGEEFGTAKRNLPPAKIVVIGVVIIVVVAAFVSFLSRAKPQGVGSIDNVSYVEVPDQNMVLVAMNVTLRNTGDKPLWIHSIQGVLKTDTGEFTDVPVSPVDYDRYFQAFPALKEHAQPALLPEIKVSPGGEAHGMVLVSFSVTKDAFEKRKSLGVVIQPYDQPRPIVLTK